MSLSFNLRKYPMAKKKRKLETKLQDDYPWVKKATLTLSFQDPTGKSQPLDLVYEDKPSTGNYYKTTLKCIYRECSNGGFNVQKEAEEMFQKRLPHVEGDLQCPGQFHRAENKTVPCGLRLHYKIDAEYFDEGSDPGAV